MSISNLAHPERKAFDVKYWAGKDEKSIIKITTNESSVRLSGTCWVFQLVSESEDEIIAEVKPN